MFQREFLQAVSDWQRGGDEHQKTRRAQRLLVEAEKIDERFRRCNFVCFRQMALDKPGLWKLLAEERLPERISAWTVELRIAKTFKGGVPPEGWQGVIFVATPPPDSVILNLDSLYRCPEFQAALQRESHSITGFADGAGRYGNSQAEVIISTESLDTQNVYALGGYSSDRDTLIRMMFGEEPTSALIAWFEEQKARAGVELGPMWLEDEPLQRVLTRMRPHVERLRAVKALQSATKPPSSI
jgi:hypothetical protein